MKSKLPGLFLMISLAMIISCVPSGKRSLENADPLASNIDSTVKPGQDFFLYANGKWFREHPIPASEQSNGLWQLIQDTINSQVKNICENAAKTSGLNDGSPKAKIGGFFFTGMDSVALNRNGLTPLKSGLERIDAIKDVQGIATEAAWIHSVSGSPLFGFYIGQDDRISSKNAIFIAQGGLSLPNRDFYFDKDARASNIRIKFTEHLGRMFILMGCPAEKAKESAARVMKLETALAAGSRKLADTRDPLKNYNKWPVEQLKKAAPSFDWLKFFETAGVNHPDTAIVGQPEFLTALNTQLKTVSLEVWKDYLKYHLVHSLAATLDDPTYKESFSFYGTVLRGIPEPKPRWKRVVEETNGSLGELIGQIYVDEYLPKGTKEKLQEIGKAIRSVYAERIKSLDWMSRTTKEKALKKLDAVIFKVGYPDKWKDMSMLKIDRASYAGNVMNANRWWFNYMVAKFGMPVDRTEWNMEPQTYNAYYNPSNNEIVVPGCNIIVPGFERKLADDAILYSIIGGSTFGHEITHGFDDQGCKYDEKGNLHNWWTPEDSIRFYAKTKMIVRQFNEFIAVDSLRINGEQTQGENIADLAGTVMGYEAFKRTAEFKANRKIAGMTPDQRYFLGYAMAWMINDRPEAIASQVRSDVHSPAKFRVLGPLANIPEFYAAFGIKPGDPMWRADSLRVRIW